MQVVAIPCLSDNYAYLILPAAGKPALVVDPSESAPVLTALSERGLTLGAILNTHHHWDHVGGNEALAAEFPQVEIYGHVSDRGRIPGQTRFLADGEQFEVEGLRFSTRHIPGHTTGAVAYSVEDAVFTGDTLFGAGCGRLFEGTPAMMHRSLNETLGALGDEVQVYFGHEYTVSNLKFAASVEPGNRDIRARAASADVERAAHKPTTPSTMGQERATNPFMRCDQPEIVAGMAARVGRELTDAVEVLAALREAKDGFQG